MQKAINLLSSFLCSEGSDFSRMFHDDYAVGIFLCTSRARLKSSRSKDMIWCRP
jgi:hypothetical protein